MARQPENPPELEISCDELAELLARLCPAAGIDLAGAVNLPCLLPHRERWLNWVAQGRHGGLDYLARNPEQRVDPTKAHPWARSVLVFAQRYCNGWPERDRDPSAGGSPGAAVSWLRRVARYARGQDYHDVLLADIRSVLAGLGAARSGLQTRTAVDTGPYLERELAWLAGLGFLGRNTCLIHERLGSGLLLGVAVTNLWVRGLAATGDSGAAQPLYALVKRPCRPAGSGPLNLCGKCTRCQDACPTGALLAEGGMDAGRCLATWTIEWRGATPPPDRPAQGGILFGCDICQAVCPWNHKAGRRGAAAPPKAAYDESEEHGRLELADLLTLDESQFRSRFRRSPLWRCHPGGLRRNALVVAGNLQRTDLAEVVSRIADQDGEQRTREAAAWCRRRIEEGVP